MPDQAKRPNQIFICYRREDTAGEAGRIYDRLVQQFGKDAIFKDVDSIPLGRDFRRHIDSVVSECRVALVVVGHRWTGTGRGNRLDDPNDPVRVEIELALKRDIPVIPILVHDAALPPKEHLPESLRDFPYRHGMTIGHDPHFHADMNRLIKHLEALIDEPAVSRPETKTLSPPPISAAEQHASAEESLPEKLKGAGGPESMSTEFRPQSRVATDAMFENIEPVFDEGRSGAENGTRASFAADEVAYQAKRAPDTAEHGQVSVLGTGRNRSTKDPPPSDVTSADAGPVSVGTKRARGSSLRARLDSFKRKIVSFEAKPARGPAASKPPQTARPLSESKWSQLRGDLWIPVESLKVIGPLYLLLYLGVGLIETTLYTFLLPKLNFDYIGYHGWSVLVSILASLAIAFGQVSLLRGYIGPAQVWSGRAWIRSSIAASIVSNSLRLLFGAAPPLLLVALLYCVPRAVFQWWVLRHRARRAYLWILANLAAGVLFSVAVSLWFGNNGLLVQRFLVTSSSMTFTALAEISCLFLLRRWSLRVYE